MNAASLPCLVSLALALDPAGDEIRDGLLDDPLFVDLALVACALVVVTCILVLWSRGLREAREKRERRERMRDQRLERERLRQHYAPLRMMQGQDAASESGRLESLRHTLSATALRERADG